MPSAIEVPKGSVAIARDGDGLKFEGSVQGLTVSVDLNDKSLVGGYVMPADQNPEFPPDQIFVRMMDHIGGSGNITYVLIIGDLDYWMTRPAYELMSPSNTAGMPNPDYEDPENAIPMGTGEKIAHVVLARLDASGLDPQRYNFVQNTQGIEHMPGKNKEDDQE